MNREMRRMAEREERLQKKKQKAEGKGASRAQAAASAAQRRRQTGERKPIHRRIAQFFHEVRVEMRKVSWPTRDQMIAFTSVTLITSVGLTLIIFGLDAGLKETVLRVIQIMGGAGG